MKKVLFVFFIQFIFFVPLLRAQIENVIVETYYISDSNDATDTTGGILEVGSKTYRIYLDMKPGTVLKKIYGDANHTLKISSTNVFFNNKSEGQSFGKDFSKSRLDENTVALDSWLTLGQISRVSTKTCFGVLKINDDDGSFIGGANNDGGSAAIAGGLLVNNNPSLVIPLYNADGYDTLTSVPTSWLDYGFKDVLSNVDSTIFGSAKPGLGYISNNAGLQNSGVVGVNPESNQVLIAQLTTRGEISFELNVEVEENDGGNTRTIKYVSNGDTLLTNEIVSPYLKYPQQCGCTDPNYLEYNAGYACENTDSCKSRIKFGCMDSLACNFDPEANFNIQELCCYPGFCNDRDLSVICPSLGTGRFSSQETHLYPNPVQGILNFQIYAEKNSVVRYKIYDSIGRLIIDKNLQMALSSMTEYIDVSNLENGIYLFQYSHDDISKTEIFVKN